MINHGHLRVLEAVAQASRDDRATMVRYIRDHARLLDEGVPVEELIERTWDGFAAMAMAEDALDDALTVLAWYEMSAEGGERSPLASASYNGERVQELSEGAEGQCDD